MSIAISAVTSPIVHDVAEPFGTVSGALEPERSKTHEWVPPAGSYSDLPLLIGIDTEHEKHGDAVKVLSYQFYAFDFHSGGWQGIGYVNGHRTRLGTLLSGAVLDGMLKGVITKWPKRICVIAHFGLADLTAFRDFKEFKFHLDAVRGTVVTCRKLSSKLWDRQHHQHLVEIIVRDSMLLAPAHEKSLDALGNLVGLPKLKLAAGEIEHMEALLQNKPDVFKSYALRDPQIAVRYYLKLMELNRQVTGQIDMPVTLASIGVKHLLQTWEREGIDKHAVLGTEQVSEKKWSNRTQQYFTRKRDVPTSHRHMYESFAAECYHGGRNESFFFGAGREGSWGDFDLCGAYTTAMACIGTPLWDQIRTTRDLEEFQPTTLGYARVRFRFPDNTRFPCLPVRTDYGLLFPLSGESCSCAPEIYLARRLGAQIEIVHGVILPVDFQQRPFERFVIDCTKRRGACVKNSLEELLWKEIANSTYGKSAQGFTEKRCFDSRSGDYRDMPPSPISNPYFAAFTTSLIRAVIGEILARLPLSASVCSVTTDGFLTDAAEEDVSRAAEGPLCQVFAQGRIRITGDPTILQVKHRIKQPLAWRTRCQATLQSADPEDIVLAKSGLKAPMRAKSEQNEWVVDQFLHRTPESTNVVSVLRSLPEIYRHGGDLVSKEIIRRLSMEYDWKRKPSVVTTRKIRGLDHLFFETAAWPSKSEFDRCRADWEDYQAGGRAVLKTEDDLTNFQEFRMLDHRDSRLKRSRKQAALTLAKRMILRAYVRSEWGLDRRTMSYSEIASWLTEIGYKTSKADLENAHRPNATLLAHAVPRTPAVEKLVGHIERRFQDFRPDLLYEKDARLHNAIAP